MNLSALWKIINLRMFILTFACLFSVHSEANNNTLAYDLVLMSNFSYALQYYDESDVKPGKIYLSEHSNYNYIMRNTKGKIQRGNLPGIDLSNLDKKLKDSAFKKSILIATSKVAHAHSIHIKYASPINGYLVQAVWQPDHEKSYHDWVVGSATIMFHNIKTNANFHLNVDNFCILKFKLPFQYSEKKDGDYAENVILNLNSYKDITLDYRTDIPKKEGDYPAFGTVNEPFFFEDIDFDGIKELLLLEAINGQRGRSTFHAYKLKSDGSLKPDLEQITDYQPYSDLDTETHINYKKHQLSIFNSNSWCDNNWSDIYKIDKTTSLYDLIAIIEYESDKDQNCHESTYKISNHLGKMVKKLIQIDGVSINSSETSNFEPYFTCSTQLRR